MDVLGFSKVNEYVTLRKWRYDRSISRVGNVFSNEGGVTLHEWDHECANEQHHIRLFVQNSWMGVFTLKI